MPDNRTRRQKLEAMAAQTVSPNEAEIARRILDTLPPDNEGEIALRRLGFNPFAALGFDIEAWMREWDRQERERRRQQAKARHRREVAAADRMGPNRESRTYFDHWTGSHARPATHAFAPSMGVRCARCGESKTADVHVALVGRAANPR